MKYLLVILSSAVIFSCNKNNEPKPDSSGLYIKFFGGAFDDHGFSVTESGDGGFYLVGSTLIPNRSDTNVLLIKVNPNGNKVWEKKFDLGDGYHEVARDIVVGLDGNIIVAGYKENQAGYFDFLLLQVDSQNPDNFEFYTFGDSLANEKAYDLILTSSGEFIVYGEKTNGAISNTTNDMYLLKTNLSDTIWVRQIGVSERNDQIGNLYLNSSDQLVWCGSVQRNDGSDMRLILADGFGNLIWDYGFEDNDFLNQYGNDLLLLPDGYLVAGSKDRSNVNPSRDIYIVRTDLNGLKSNEHTNTIILSETSSQEAYSIISDGSGNFVLTGYATSDRGDKDIYVAKINASGSIIKSEKFGGAGNDLGRKIIKTDNGYLLIGTVYAGNNTMVGVYKLNEELELVD